MRIAGVIDRVEGFLAAECRCEGGGAIDLEERDLSVPTVRTEEDAGRMMFSNVPGIGRD